MKLSKFSLIPMLALVLFLASPLTAGAREVKAPDPKELAKLESLHDQLWGKKMELKAMQQAGNVQETRATVAEITKLKAQIREERQRLGDPGRGRDMNWGHCDCPADPKGRGPGKGGHKWGPGGKEHRPD